MEWGAVGWGWQHSCSEPFSSARLRTSLAPITAYMSFWSLNQPCKQVSILLGLCSCGVQSRHHLAAALSLSGSGVCCQITLDCCAGEAASARSFPVHVCMCCSQRKRVEAVQGPCVVLHWVIVSQRLESHQAFPSMGLCLQSVCFRPCGA